MKTRHIILVGDGMGDYPLEELKGRTPLEAARTPHMDRLVAMGRLGTVRTVPRGMEPGSDIANMSLLGYDPRKYHTGRAPLEAASMGVHLSPEDVAFRCNLVTLAMDDALVVRMEDYSAGHISHEEAHQLIEALKPLTVGKPLDLYQGVSYRHLLVWHGGVQELDTTPPHDISGKSIERYGRVYGEHPVLQEFIVEAGRILENHEINRQRLNSGRKPANALWLWGQGRSPSMPTLQDRYGFTGAMISAVDLLKGLGVCAGLEAVYVPGATGYLDTNYAGKVSAALKALETGDLVYLHIEAPDEMGHAGDLEKKIQAIEAFDERVVGPMMEGAVKFDQVRVLLVTDHLTPIEKRTHVSDPVPFLLVDDLKKDAIPVNTAARFTEAFAEKTGWQLDGGSELFEVFIGKAN